MFVNVFQEPLFTRVGDAKDLGFGRVEVQIAGVGNDNKNSGGVSKCEDKILCSNT